MEGVIVEVVVDDALSDSIVLIGILNNWLLEVPVEAKHLTNFSFSYFNFKIWAKN